MKNFLKTIFHHEPDMHLIPQIHTGLSPVTPLEDLARDLSKLNLHWLKAKIFKDGLIRFG